MFLSKLMNLILNIDITYVFIIFIYLLPIYLGIYMYGTYIVYLRAFFENTYYYKINVHDIHNSYQLMYIPFSAPVPLFLITILQTCVHIARRNICIPHNTGGQIARQPALNVYTKVYLVCLCDIFRPHEELQASEYQEQRPFKFNKVIVKEILSIGIFSMLIDINILYTLLMSFSMNSVLCANFLVSTYFSGKT